MAKKIGDFAGEKFLTPALIFLVCFIASVPTISQLFYWITGAVYYTTGILMSAVGIGLIVEREREPSAWVDGLLFLITLIIVGNNEIALIGWMEILLSYMLLKYVSAPRLRSWRISVDNFLAQ
jgi:hypothetical protein